MKPKEDAIVDIPKGRLRFFGGAGKMLLVTQKRSCLLAGHQKRREDSSLGFLAAQRGRRSA